MKTYRIAAALGSGLALALALTAATPAHADVPVVTLYQHNNFGGAAFSQSGPHLCNDSLGDTEYTNSALTSFNDITSSFQGHSNCWVRLYEHANFGGATFGWFGQASSVGPMNDLASSFKLT